MFVKYTLCLLLTASFCDQFLNQKLTLTSYILSILWRVIGTVTEVSVSLHNLCCSISLRTNYCNNILVQRNLKRRLDEDGINTGVKRICNGVYNSYCKKFLNYRIPCTFQALATMNLTYLTRLLYSGHFKNGSDMCPNSQFPRLIISVFSYTGFLWVHKVTV